MYTLLHSSKCKGNINFILESHSQHHRNAVVSLTSFVQHVYYQQPNGHTRVVYILESIVISDAVFQLVMSEILNDKGATVMCSKFEAASVHLLPMDPVEKRIVTFTKRVIADISGTKA